MQKRMFKSEKGSITLFVLLAILFFLIVIFSVFMNSSNKNRIQISELDKIKQEYEKDVDNIDQIYDDVASKELIQIAFDKNGNIYNIAKDGTVDISSNVSISYEEDITIVSREYGWSNSSEKEPTSWTSFAENTITVTNKAQGQGSYYLWIRVKNDQDVTNTTASNVFQVYENEIGLSKDINEYTKDKVTVTIDYKDTYVAGKKVGIGKTVDEAMKNAVANENTTVEVTENSFVYVTAEDAYGNVSSNYIEIDNIDIEAPMITLTPNGDEYIVKNNDTMQINVLVEVEDKVSGVKEVKYYWGTSNTEKPTDEEYTITENNKTVSSEQLGEGTYYLWIKATDNVGNVREEPSYAYIVKPPLAPEVILKENDANGKEYTSGTWTNQNVYHEISLPTTEGTVEKYQYSNDGNTWEDINGEIKKGELNYSTSFPMTDENKPDWLGNVTANGRYYFDIDESTGTLTSAGEHGNKGKSSTTANSYIPIDLSNYSEDDQLTISLNYTISSESVNYDIGYATITETTTAPAYNSSTNRFIKVGGSLTTSEQSITISGGKLYYLHLGYRKDGSKNSGNDSFVINSITLTSETLGEKVQFYNYNKNENTITYILQDEISKDFYVKAIYKDGNESGISQFRIQIDKTAPVIGNISSELTSQTKLKLIVSDIRERDSGLKGYYISTEETQPTVDSNWISASGDTFEIENLNVGTKYYIWLIDNANNISEMKEITEISVNYRIDNTKYAETLEKALILANNNSSIELLNDYTDESTATIDKDIILNTGNYTLNRTKTITINGGTEEEPITFELNGKVTSSSNINTLTSNKLVIINGNGIIESTVENDDYFAIDNNGILIQNGELIVSGYYRGISNSGAIYTLNSGKVQSTYDNSSAYGISYGNLTINGGEVSGYTGIYQPSTLIINNGTVTGTGQYGIYNSSGTLNVNDGKIIGNTYGIYAYSSGTINVNGGYISGTHGIYVSNSSATVKVLGGTVVGSTYGIYGYTTRDGKITIGEVNTEVSQVSPVVSGGQYGIYMRNNNAYNFYNGVIMGTNTKPYTDTVNPRQGYMVYTYYNYDVKRYCSVLTTIVDEIEIMHTPTEWTNQDVSVEIKYPIIEGTTLQYSKDAENWENIDNGNGNKIMISSNCKVYARILDASGIVIQSAEHEITNIDKIVPTITINPETTKYIVDEINPTVDISVTANASDEGGSELSLKQYGWSDSKDAEPSKWNDFGTEDMVTITKNDSEEGIYYLWFNITDNAGNKSDVTVIRYIVEYKDFVATILETGEKYYTIQEAIEAAGTTSSTIQIIKDTDEVSTIEEGQNITIDLNGHTVGSSTNNQATITNNGTLTIIDNSENDTGTIENLIGTALDNNGALTIGDNTNTINDNAPTILGKKTGIKNNNTLNYYDGTIIGKSAIDGNVQGTPESYGPVGIYREEDGMTVVNLRIISDYVARIEWFYYSTLQSAFDACPARENNTEQTTVHMLKDIILDDTVNSYYGQNIQLNLNNHMLTNIKSTTLKNIGKLEITDLSNEKSGTINSSVEDISNIVNNGELTISKIKINSDKDGNKIIDNYNALTLLDVTIINDGRATSYGIINTNGTVNAINSTIDVAGGRDRHTQSYAIYNQEDGQIYLDGCNIKSSSGIGASYYRSYAIYNKNSGSIDIKNSIIRTSGWHGECISNRADGTINILDGKSTINSSHYGIYNYANGVINIRSLIEADCKENIIYNQSVGKVNINEGTITNTNNNQYYTKAIIVNLEEGLITINSGTVTSVSTCISNSGNGVINMISGTLNSNDSCIFNSENGIINITDGLINCEGKQNKNAYGINNNRNGTINIAGGKINVNGYSNSFDYDRYVYGIYNGGNGNINLKGGKISSNSTGRSFAYGIYNTTSGTITLGIKDNNINANEPSIESTSSMTSGNITLYNDKAGIIYFYDGIIKASESIIYGGITQIEDNCKITEDENTSEGTAYKRIYLTKQNSDDYIIENITSGKQYSNVKDAIAEITSDAYKLKVLQDLVLDTEFLVTENTNIQLDLNGKVITNPYFKIINSGNLEITDNLGNGKIVNKETFILNIDNGNISINDSIVECNSMHSGSALCNTDNGVININSGKINSNSNGISNYKNGTINISNGTFNVELIGIVNSEQGIINMISGTINSKRQGISSNSTQGIINIFDGSINVNAEDASATGISEDNTGTINIYGGEIDIETDETAYGIDTYRKATVNIINGSISVYGGYNGYGIYNNSRNN